MNDPKPQQPQPQKPGMMLEKAESRAVEFIPFGAQDKIKVSVSIVQNYIAKRTKSGKTCSERDAIQFIAMIQARKLNPFEGDAFLIGYDGKDGPQFSLITAHQAFLKRAEVHPEFDGMKSGVIVRENGALKDLEGDFFDEGQEVVGGWATVYFKKRQHPMNKRLRLTRFQKPFGIWQEDPAGMIVKCAEADALRSSFPTMLGGLYLREEMDSQQTQTSKPEFAVPASRALFASPATTAPAASIDMPDNGRATTPVQQDAPDPDPIPEQEAPSPLVVLRNLCRSSKVPESVLLGYLTANGATDGSSATLEELSMTQGGDDVIASTVDQWADISSKILAGMGGMKKGGGK